MVKWGPDLFELLDNARLFVLPSLTEGMPNALVEAMVSGLAFVASDIEEILEIVPPELNTQLFDPNDITGMADGLYELCTNSNKRQMVSAKCKEWTAKNYTIQNSVNILCQHWIEPFLSQEDNNRQKE